MAGSAQLRTVLTAALVLTALSERSWPLSHADSPQPAVDDSGGLAEIVVTAQKREQNLQNVPIAVSAFSADDLAKNNVTNVVDLSKIDSSIYVSEATGIVVTFIRGIGNPINNTGNESSVAYYVDGVYYPRLPAAFFELNNVERVEVLAGPQGTLFGRNSSAGLVQILTKEPSFSPALHVDVGYGNYNTTNVQLYAADGFGQHVAGDVAIIYNNQADGWGRNVFNGDEYGQDNYKAIRSKWNFDLPSETTAKIILDYRSSRTSTGIPTGPYEGTTAGGIAAPFPEFFPSKFYDTNSDVNPISYDEGWSATQKLTHDFSFMTVSNLANFQHATEQVEENVDGTPLMNEKATINSVATSYSDELQFQSVKSSPADWIVGLYFLNDYAAYDPVDIVGTAITRSLKTAGAYIANYGDQRTEAFSIYSQSTIHLPVSTNLTLGARYNYDTLHGYGHEDGDVDGNRLLTIVSGDVRTHFDKATFKAGLDHHFTDDVMSYISYSSGFKDGTFNLLPISPEPVKPESVDAYEIGTKTSLFDNRLRLNGALFYNKIHDPQVREIITGVTTFVNAKSAVSKGFEFSADARLMKGLTVRLGLTVLSAKYTEFDNAPTTHSNPKAPFGNVPYTAFDASGQWLSHASPDTVTSGLDYQMPTSFGLLGFGLSDYYNAGFYWDPDNVTKQRAYNVVDAQASLALTDHHSKVTVWGKNITDTHYYLVEAEQASPFGDISAPAAPSTYGVRFSYDF